jgi:hypothetical protein
MADQHSEYLRRNLLHCQAVGAHGIAKQALTRLLAMRRPPMWIIGALEGIERRTALVHPEMAAWRNTADDAPDYVLNPRRKGSKHDR